MSRFARRIRRLRAGALFATLLIALVSAPAAQQPSPEFRVTTQLINSYVLVFNTRGEFVSDLQREQFELLVDGKPQPILFFESVQAGSATEQIQLAAARGESAPASSPPLLEGGRSVLFFVDDFHLKPDSLVRARRVVESYVDHDMGPRDLAAIGSASGQLGFLEQTTGSATMLHSAAARLKYRTRDVIDVDMPRMPPNQAQIIERGSDRELFEFFVKETLRQNPLMKRLEAEAHVTMRARMIVQQSGAVVRDTIIALGRFVAAKAQLPGRKVIFFLSDGFATEPADPDLANIADIAAGAGAVVYTMDVRGLITQPSYDASRAGVFSHYDSNPDLSDHTKGVERAEADEVSTSQDPLHRIATEAGGRAIVNTNGLVEAIGRVLKETAAYYVLAWAPDEAQQNRRFHRIGASVRGRPELRVRIPRGVYGDASADPRSASPRTDVEPPRPASIPGAAVVEADLLAALRSPFPVRTLPTSLTLDFLDLPNVGTVIKASAHITGETVVDVAVAVFNDAGLGVSSLKQQVTLTANRATLAHQFKVKPGLYQVRISARDAGSGRVGSAMEWIDIPVPGSGPFSISSPLVDREASRLRFHTYVYNARRSAKTGPDVVLKFEVFRGDKRVIATPSRPLKITGVENPSRIPYFGELNLAGMPSGSYVLQVTATDRTARADTSTRATFDVE